MVKRRFVLAFILTILIGCQSPEEPSNPVYSSRFKFEVKQKAKDTLTYQICHKLSSSPHFIVDDFNGDGLLDTIYESYISNVTKKPLSKVIDSLDWDKSIAMVYKMKPVIRLYSSIHDIDTVVITANPGQFGFSQFRSLGDLDGDRGAEFGYFIDLADYSNLNTFHVMTLKDNKVLDLFAFPIHEEISFFSSELFNGNSIIKHLQGKRVKYRFYSDSGVVSGVTTLNRRIR